MIERPFWNLRTSPHGLVDRRAFLRHLAVGAGAAGAVQLSWRDMLIARADEIRRAGKSMILLWMDGGPSQHETFNPKIGSDFQGPTGAIPTNLPGVHIGEHWPETAQVMDKIALIRSMVSTEVDHFRAIKEVRTGYPITPAINYPTWGSVVARDRRDPNFELPAFVRIGRPRITTRDVTSGVLGPRYESFKIDVPGELPEEVLPAVDPEVLRRRLTLAAELDQEFGGQGGADVVDAQREVYDRAARFVLSPRLNVFNLDEEPDALRDAYGRTTFGQGCLLARRLVEAGTSFIEVISGVADATGSDQGWDTHKKGFDQNPILAGETDPAYATLLRDLEDRGMLENTLVVWMGEFGRTPRFKPNGDGGREHYAKGWITCLSGGGVQPGQVIGATDDDGNDVTDRPVSIQDLFCSFCHVLDMDPRDEYYTDQNQPLKLVEGGEVIEELF